jgi:Domain of unknown function (DUF4276)
MSNIKILVEGPTEILFVNEVLKPHFHDRGIYVKPFLFHKAGGIPKYSTSKRQILNTIRSDPSCFCTTMVDFYGMPADWPGRKQANCCHTPTERAEIIEASILKDIAGQLGGSFDSGRLMPYVQMHEFEALLFSFPEKLAESLGDKNLLSAFMAIRNKFSTPEEINDHYDTCPSRRIEGVLQSFKKTINGIFAASIIGLERMRRECPHFNEWITKLEGIGRP